MEKLKEWLESRYVNERVHLRRLYDWLSERLWVKPLVFGLGATLIVWLCTLADWFPIADYVWDISQELIETNLAVLTASMLGVATFAVASMVQAYNSIGSNATPRAFALIVADDISKRALSSFIGAFIFGTIGMIAINLKFYDKPGRFALFCVTLIVYAGVIWVFLRWVDSIARLGRMETAISRVERAAAKSLSEHVKSPYLGCAKQTDDMDFSSMRPVFSSDIGYLQDIDVAELQERAEECGGTIHVTSTPGSFVGPGRPLAYIEGGDATFNDGKIVDAYFVGEQRSFTSDPRFGLVVLAQIASRALSPGINDPGTAIDVLGSQTRLILDWSFKRHLDAMRREAEPGAISYPNVTYPRLDVAELFEDAFTSIARDGSGQVEVMVRFQRDMQLLAAAQFPAVKEAALQHSKWALQRARLEDSFAVDIERIELEAEHVVRIDEKEMRSVDDTDN